MMDDIFCCILIVVRCFYSGRGFPSIGLAQPLLNPITEMIVVCMCVCVCVVYKVFKKEVKWKSNNTETEQKVSTSKPFSVWMRLSSGAGMSSLSFPPKSISLHLFKYLLAEPASLSPPWYPGRLPSPHSHASSPPPAASLAGLKS